MYHRKIPLYQLNNGYTIPVIGLGTWQSPPDKSVYKAVRYALDAGYRHLDCAFAYENQEEIGWAIADAIKDGVLKRKDLFVTSKIWPTYYRSDRVPICAKKILSDLKLEYIDLLLLHWPQSLQQRDDTLLPKDPKTGQLIVDGISFMEAYHALEDLVNRDLVRSIGVSNFNVDQLKRLLAVARIKPVTNQVESHPYLVQSELKSYCATQQIVLTAFSPLGNPGSNANSRPDKDRLLKDPVVEELAKKYDKNAGQILIKYQLARGNLVIPKSIHKDRIISNLNVFDFHLTPAEMADLNSLDRGYRSCSFPEMAHFKDYPF